jgi:Domain of unknown function (DUF5658)
VKIPEAAYLGAEMMPKKVLALLLWIAVQAGDFVTTAYATTRHVLPELNPVVGKGTPSLWWLLFLKLATVALAYWFLWRHSRRMWLFWTVLGIYALVVLGNIISVV